MKRPPVKLKPEHALPLILLAVVLSLTFIVSLRSKLRSQAAPPTASAPANPAASDAAAKDYSWVQNTEQDNILNARREAKEQVGASDIAAWANTPPPADTPAAPPETLPDNLPPLPETCERYYQRVDQCFARQGEDAEALRASNQDLRAELARSRPTENECAALDRSFDTLAPTLGCR
ncbi:hypothetical protein [Kingella oralis]|uniref:hypothetical protein n=1 Tax=Kingella oralis TaxID=505 RepID=UPI0028EE0C96|nr:hypothetical protein [Kingella oralis]